MSNSEKVVAGTGVLALVLSAWGHVQTMNARELADEANELASEANELAAAAQATADLSLEAEADPFLRVEFDEYTVDDEPHLGLRVTKDDRPARSFEVDLVASFVTFEEVAAEPTTPARRATLLAEDLWTAVEGVEGELRRWEAATGDPISAIETALTGGIEFWPDRFEIAVLVTINYQNRTGIGRAKHLELFSSNGRSRELTAAEMTECLALQRRLRESGDVVSGTDLSAGGLRTSVQAALANTAEYFAGSEIRCSLSSSPA